MNKLMLMYYLIRPVGLMLVLKLSHVMVERVNFCSIILFCELFNQIRLFFFFFLESFNLWRPLLMKALYHQTKTPISF